MGQNPEDQLHLMRTLFEKKKSSDVIRIFEVDKGFLERFSSGERPEIEMMVAFCYFDLRKFDSAAYYGIKVIENLKRDKLIADARDLFYEMTVICLKSLITLHRNFKAYMFLRRMLKSGLQVDVTIQDYMDRIANGVSRKVYRMVDYGVIAIFVIVTLLQNIFSFLSSPQFRIVLVCFIVVSVIQYVTRSWYYRWMEKIVKLGFVGPS